MPVKRGILLFLRCVKIPNRVRRVCPMALFLIFWLALPMTGAAAETEDPFGDISMDMDYSDVQNVIDQAFEYENKITFSDIVDKLTSGDTEGIGSFLLDYVKDQLFYEISMNRKVILQIIGVAVIGAIFTNISMTFAKNYVAETGFYFTYMILFALLGAAYMATASIVTDVLHRLIQFMTALVPTFSLAIAFVTGKATSLGYYQGMLLVITFMDWFMSKVLIGLVNVYIVLSMINNLSKEDYLSKSSELLETVVAWSLRTVLAVTLGFNVIQGLLLPAIDSTKGKMLIKASTMIPGIGNALNSAAKVVVGAGILIKNAVGVAGLVVLLILCAAPLLKLVTIALMYKVVEAVIQPVSDKRLVECVHTAGNGIVFLMKILGTALILFMLSLAIIMASSNMGLGG